MPELRASERARLPNSAFAYIDSTGRRWLPIHDPAHVRNALARFGRVDFEDEAARDQARLRLLKAARRYGVSPIGFVAGQLEPQRKLPTGIVTFLMCDLEGSTQLLATLGEDYSRLRSDVRRIVRTKVRQVGGREVDTRADELFAAFASTGPALQAAVHSQLALSAGAWPAEARPLMRMGIHVGRPTLTNAGYVGLAVHAVARVCAVGHGGQILITRSAARVAGDLPAGYGLRDLGAYRLRGLDEPLELLQVTAPGLVLEFPPPRSV